MSPEAAALMRMARTALADAQRIAAAGVHAVAAREAYIAAMHAAQALVCARQGTVPKTHRALHAAFGRLATQEPTLGPELGRRLARLYKFKDIADYGRRETIPPDEAQAALPAAAELIERVAAALEES